jgi:hypothetical protein
MRREALQQAIELVVARDLPGSLCYCVATWSGRPSRCWSGWREGSRRRGEERGGPAPDDIGAAWEIDDEGVLWAAHQHDGDPTFSMRRADAQ